MKVVSKLFFCQDVATVAMGVDVHEGPNHTYMFDAPGQIRNALTQLVEVGLFPAEAVLPSKLVGAANLQPVIAKVEGFPLDYGDHKHASCLAGRFEVQAGGFEWISNHDA